jgi:hypothetical protein
MIVATLLVFVPPELTWSGMPSASLALKPSFCCQAAYDLRSTSHQSGLGAHLVAAASLLASSTRRLPTAAITGWF